MPLLLGFVLFVVGGLLVVVWVGILFVAGAVPLIRVVANRQRHIAGRVLGVDLPPPYRPLPESGPLVRLRAVLTDPMTWRDLVWILWAITFGWAISLLVIVLLLSIVTGFFWWFGTYPLLWMRSQVDRALLTYGSTETLEQPGRGADPQPGRGGRPLRGRAAPAGARPARRRPRPGWSRCR